MLAALAVCMAACGGKGSGDGSSEKKDAITLKTEVQEIGDFANYASFPDEMKIKLAEPKENTEETTEGDANGTVKLILLESLDVHTAVCTDVNFSFDFNIADEDYGEITQPQSMYIENKTDLNAKWEKGKRFSSYLEKGIMRYELQFTLTTEEWEKVLNKGKYIIIKPSNAWNKYRAYGQGGSSVGTDDSEDWDSILDRYEEIVDKWLSLVNRAANGDASAASESAEVMEEAQELAERVTNAKSSLSSSQLSRFTSIAQKAANAAQQMQ